MTSLQEGRDKKIGTVIGVIGLVIAFLAWIHPFAPRSSNISSADLERAPVSSEVPVQPPPVSTPFEHSVHPETSSESRPSNSGKPSTEGLSSTGSISGEAGDTQPQPETPNLTNPVRACQTPETATLRPGSSARVASGLAVLSVSMAREGSEPYLSLNISSDRDTLTQAVLGVSLDPFRFKTSLGTYFVNVTEADLTVGTMTIQVGCEAEGNTL
jgi:hypothetical protein